MTVKTIREILGNRRVFSVSPGMTLREASKVMAENGVGAVAVLEDECLVGILSERDIVFRGLGQDLRSDETAVSETMTPDPVTIEIDDAISEALAAKLGDVFRHLPVMDNGRVVGVLSYRDIPAEYVMMFERFREMTAARADA